MNGLKKCVSIALITSMVFCLSSCKGEETTQKQDYNKVLREPAPEAINTDFADKDGVFEYGKTTFVFSNDQVIVTPTGDKQAKKTAEKLKSFISTAYGVDVSVTDDSVAAKAQEILVGKTNRKESNLKLSENELEVSVKNNKLDFDGGHYVTVNSAVEKFIRLAPPKGTAYTFSVKTDFSSAALDGYEYVWGDEFEGNDIDLTKWDFEARMGGTNSIELSWEKDTINVSDGRLKLNAIRYYNPHNEGTQYRVPYSTLTKYKMNYLYGYAEIRARLPFFNGAWPSFWALSSSIDKNGKYDPNATAKWNYTVEIDIFEVFGHESKVIPCLHKWYQISNYDYEAIHNANGDAANTSLGGGDINVKNGKEIALWDWADVDDVDINNLDKEYHLYGFEWTNKELNMYVDGKKYQAFDIVNSYDDYNDMSRFHEPIYLMFNNHLMADDSNHKTTIINTNNKNLPSEYFIDWIRLYQKKGVGKLYIDETPREYVGR